MSDTQPDFDPEDFEGVQPKMIQLSRSQIRGLEKKAKLADSLAAENAGLKRQFAMTKAGIPDGGLGVLFAKAYDGPVDDIDAMRAAAIEYGVIQGDGPSRDELEAHRRTAGASAGAGLTSGQPDLNSLIANAKNAAEVQEIVRQHNLRLPRQP